MEDLALSQVSQPISLDSQHARRELVDGKSVPGCVRTATFLWVNHRKINVARLLKCSISSARERHCPIHVHAAFWVAMQ